MDKESGMKPSREEVLRAANECFSSDLSMTTLHMIEHFAAAMYEAGAAAERAVSDRLLEALKVIVTISDRNHAEWVEAHSLIADVEAMRKEQE